LSKFERLAKTPKGQAEVARKYQEAFGSEFPQLIKDLQRGKLTENTRSLLFSELSDAQPITRAEMPQAYLDHPNGRALYMLRTFMLKQLDIVRRDGVNEIKKGNVARGIYNLTRYGLLLGIAGATTNEIQNWILGRKVDFKAIDIPLNIIKTFGWSQYTIDKAKHEGILAATASTIAPPYKMWDRIIRRDPSAVQYIPLIGKIFYNREMGGAKKADKAEANAAKRRKGNK
jgi:hypothetical protein